MPDHKLNSAGAEIADTIKEDHGMIGRNAHSTKLRQQELGVKS
jgi:hypothetical protein